MRILRRILVILAAVFLLVLALMVIAQTPPVRRFVLHKAAEALRSRGIEFQASALRYNLFTLRASLTGVVIRSVSAPSLPPVATIPRIDVQARWGELLGGTIGIENVSLERPTIEIVRERSGRDNLPRLQGMAGGGKTSFFLGRLTASGGTLRLIDRQRKLAMTLPWQLAIEGNRRSGAYALHLSAGPGAPIHLDGREIPLDRVVLEAVLRGERLNVERLEVSAANSTISASGTLAPLRAPRANLAIALQAAAARWARILRVKQPVRGQLSARLTASGTLASLLVTGTMRTTRFTVGKLGAIGLEARLRLDMATRQLALESADVSLLGGTVHGKGTIALAAGTSRLGLQLAKLDLARLCRALNLPIEIASRAQGTAQGTWPGLSFLAGTWHAEMKLARERQTPALGVAPVAGSLTAVLHGGETRVRLRGIQAMATRLNGQVAIGTGQKIRGTLRADVPRFSGLMDSVGAYLGKPPPLANRHLEGRAGVTATLAGKLNAPQVRARISLDDLSIGRPARPLPAMQADLTLSGRHAELLARIPSLGLLESAQAELRAPYPLKITAELPKTKFAALPVALPAGLTGEISLALRAQGDLRHWRQGTADARIESLQGRWRNLPVELRRPAEIQFQAGEVGVEASLGVKDSFLELSGKLPLRSGAPGAVRVQGHWNLATLDSLLPQEQQPEAAGQLDVSGEIRGSLERLDPALKVSLENGSIAEKRLGAPLTGLTLHGELRGSIFDVRELSANWAGGRLKGSGRLPLAWLPVKLPPVLPAKSEPVTLSFAADGLKLQEIRGVPQTAKGTISLQARAQAARPALDAVRAMVTIPQIDLDLAGFSFREPRPGRITLENGVARIAEFALSGPRTNIRAEGTADFHSPHPLDVKVSVESNAAVLASMVPSLSAEGPVQLHLSVKGTTASPQLSGYFQTQNAKFALETPPVLADGMNVRVDFSGSRATIAHFQGSLNGGELKASGGLSYARGRVRDVNIDLQGTGMFLQYPRGMKTLSNAKLQLRSEKRALVLGGQVIVVQGSYRRTLNIERDLIPYVLGSGGGFTPLGARNALLERLRFNLGINTASPLVMDNNLGQLAIDANLRLTGGYYNMGLLGLVTMEQGGTLRLNERTYTIDRGTITFTSPESIEATPDIVAKTQAAGYDITLQVTKQAGKIRTELTSQPPLSQGNIVSILLTGRTLQEASGAVGTIAEQQALSLLAGQIGQTLSTQVQGGLGLTTVRLEPSLISAESSPGARLLVGQNITPRLNLSYSVNLANTGDQVWAAQYDLTPRFTGRAVMQGDNSYRFELRQSLSFGGLPLLEAAAIAKRKQPRIAAVHFTGSPGFPPEQLAGRLKVKPGDRYNFFKVQKGVEKLQKFYWKQNFLEASIRTSPTVHDGKADLQVHIDAGPKVDFSFAGWSPSSGTREKVRKEWRTGAFEEQRVNNAVDVLRGALVHKGYLQAKVTTETGKSRSDNRRTVRFQITQGARFRNVKIVFAGAKRIPPSALKDLLEDQKQLANVYLQPAEVTRLLTSYYHAHGYLAAKVKPPRYELDARSGTGKTVIAVSEGPLFRVGTLKFEGNTSYSTAKIAGQAGLKSGETYLPELGQKAGDNIRSFYLNHGFSNVTVRTTSQQKDSAAVVDLAFRIRERKQRVVKQIEISGTRYTTPSLVRKQLAIKPGQVLGSNNLGKSLTRLYETGAYSDVNIEPQELPLSPGLGANQQAVRLQVKLHEVPPWQLSYGGYYDTDRGPGGVVDLSNHNMLGGARTIGLRVRYDDLYRGSMVYLSQPRLRKFFPKADLAGYATRDQRDAFVSKTLGLSFQQEVPLQSHYVVTYGYRLERDTSIALSPGNPSLNSQQRIAPLTFSLTRETRNDFLDATRGMFVANALEVGTKYFGSQVHYVRYVGQYFQYVPLSRPVTVPFSRMKRARYVWASGIRIGLEGGLGGQEVNPSQRFFAGGGTTIRGFGQDEVGPKDSTGQPVGGNAVFILNQEFRFPLFSIFGGSAFVDVGNVYPSVRDFNPFKVRSAAGLGLLIRTPFAVLRIDYGFKLDRRRGESLGQLFIGIGQAY